VYYGLNRVGLAVWEFIKVPRRMAEIETAILTQFEVDEVRCRNDLEQLLRALNEHRLIRFTEAPR